ncbi:MAG: hypothetical protein ACREL5_13960 [Gemmatimonadales bacterium]
MRRLLLPALLLVAGCSDVISPLLIHTYDFRDIEGSDTLTFHWPREMLPVRVWVASDSPLRPYVETAIQRWEDAFLYGEFQATIVADSNHADVIVRNVPADNGGLAAMAKECVGEVDRDIDLDSNTMQLPIHVFVYAVVSDIVPGIPTCYSITMTHEMGHVLGIINPLHAGATPTDVMYADPVFDGISEHDRETAVFVYHSPSSLTAVGRR